MFAFEYDWLESISNPQQKAAYTQVIGHPRRFQLLLQPSMPDKHVREIERVVEAEKPVHTDADVEKLKRRCQLSGHTYLGINTVLPNHEFEVGESALGQQTRLGRVGQTSTDRRPNQHDDNI
jgi:hypothetical protein